MAMLRWRDYRTALGRSPVREFLRTLSLSEQRAVASAMGLVAREGLVAARHLRGSLYEVGVEARRQGLRILFAQEAKFILLSLVGFQKKTRKTPANELAIAQQRLDDWRERGA